MRRRYWSRIGALMPFDTSKLIREINLPELRNALTTSLYCDALERVPFLKARPCAPTPLSGRCGLQVRWLKMGRRVITCVAFVPAGP